MLRRSFVPDLGMTFADDLEARIDPNRLLRRAIALLEVKSFPGEEAGSRHERTVTLPE